MSRFALSIGYLSSSCAYAIKGIKIDRIWSEVVNVYGLPNYSSRWLSVRGWLFRVPFGEFLWWNPRLPLSCLITTTLDNGPISFGLFYDEAMENPDESDGIASNSMKERQKVKRSRRRRDASFSSKPIDEISSDFTLRWCIIAQNRLFFHWPDITNHFFPPLIRSCQKYANESFWNLSQASPLDKNISWSQTKNEELSAARKLQRTNFVETILDFPTLFYLYDVAHRI